MSHKESQRWDMTRTENDMRMNDMESHSRVAVSDQSFESNFVECPPCHAAGDAELLQFLMICSHMHSSCK